MYKLKETVDLEELRKYGFTQVKEVENYTNFMNDWEADCYWLISMDPDNPKEVMINVDGPAWYMQVMEDRTIWIEMTPNSTYHICGEDCKEMFNILYHLIKDDLIVLS